MNIENTQNSIKPTFEDALRVLQELSIEYKNKGFEGIIKRLGTGELTPDGSLDEAKDLIKKEKLENNESEDPREEYRGGKDTFLDSFSRTDD